MSSKNLILASNFILLTAATSTVLWLIKPVLLVLGLLLGALLSWPTWQGFRQSKPLSSLQARRLYRIDLWVLLLFSALITIDLYRHLAIDSRLFLPSHLIALLLSLGLGAQMQLIQLLYAPQRDNTKPLQRLFSGPSVLLTLCIGTIVADLILALITASQGFLPFAATLHTKLLERGFIPPLCLILFCWHGLLLLGKFVMLREEWQQLFGKPLFQLEDNPSLSAAELRRMIEQRKASRSRPARVACLEQMLEMSWQTLDYFYTIPRYINWAIPLLGFIGTVLGISLAAESIGAVISAPDTSLSSGLSEALSPLGLAFDTTLIALSLSVILMFLQTLLQRWEERRLTDMERLFRENL